MPPNQMRYAGLLHQPKLPLPLPVPVAKTMPQSKPKISIIGLGRLGTALALALSRRGYHLEALISHRPKRGPTRLDVKAKLITLKDLSQLSDDAIVIIATPDDAIQDIARQLAKVHLSESAGRFVFHTSGALSSNVLAPLLRVGWKIGSIHPLLSVSDGETGAQSLHGAYWCIEGQRQAMKVARTLIQELGGNAFSIAASKKALYHSAALMASGNVVALFDIAIQMLGYCGLTPGSARKVLLPLLASTVQNLSSKDPSHALTGTFARGDLRTVQAHLKALSKKELQVAQSAYKLLGKRSAELAETSGLHKKLMDEILEALS